MMFFTELEKKQWKVGRVVPRQQWLPFDFMVFTKSIKLYNTINEDGQLILPKEHGNKKNTFFEMQNRFSTVWMYMMDDTRTYLYQKNAYTDESLGWEKFTFAHKEIAERVKSSKYSLDVLLNGFQNRIEGDFQRTMIVDQSKRMFVF